MLRIQNFPYPEKYEVQDNFAEAKSLTLPYLQGIPVIIFKAFDACLSLCFDTFKKLSGEGAVLRATWL